MKWRGRQPKSDKQRQLNFAEQFRTTTYQCELCGWAHSMQGMVYDAALHVCSTCTARVVNFYHKKHGGQWTNERAVSDDDLAWFGETREMLERPRFALPGKKKISNTLRFRVYERDKFKCVYCKSPKDLTCDHVTAESKGGATSFENLVTCCKTCNSRKKTKTLQDFWETRQ